MDNEEIIKSIEETSDSIVELESKLDGINDTLKIIDAVSKQTNLLALNATIEAARAGDAGKGFAVVANEVKELAKESAKAAKEVTDNIKTIKDVAVKVKNSVNSVLDKITDEENQAAEWTEEVEAAPDSAQSLFDRLGGKDAVNAAVDIFYEKVLADGRISHFFEGIDMLRQRNKQKAFLTFAFGGAPNYSGKSLREGHKKLVEQGLSDEHFDAVIENLGATLQELNVPEELIQEAAAIALSTRNDVLNR